MFEVHTKGEGLEVAWEGEGVLEYRPGCGDGRPHWHPVRLPGGPALTWDAPPDHVHHHGMWLAWKAVNGVNFWERPDGDDWTGFGRIVHREVSGASAGADRARFTAESDWVDWQGTLHLTDRRRTTVRRPERGRMAIDLSLELRAAGQPVTLDLARGDPGEFGIFYSGLTVRFAESLGDGRLLDSEGRTDADAIYGARAAWCGWSGVSGEDGRAYGITIVDAPGNARHPSPWWARNMPGYALIQPSLCYHEPIELAPGEGLTLDYTVVVHEGHVSADLAST